MNLLLPKRGLILPRRMRPQRVPHSPRGFILNPFVLSGGGGGGGPPVLLFDAINTTGEANWGFANSDGWYYGGHSFFTDGSPHSITKVVVKLSMISGDISAKSYFVKIHADAANDLGALIGASDLVAGNNAWNSTLVDFNFSTPANLSAGANYHIVVGQTGASDGANYAAFYTTTPAIIAGYFTLFSNTGVNGFPGTFTNYNVELQIWGN
jgi:hypothetical protein